MADTTQNRFEDPVIGACPLDPAWRLWDMFPPDLYNYVAPEHQRILELSRRTSLSRKLETLELPWRIADDDGSKVPMTPAESGQPDWKYAPGCPFHIHTDARIGDNLVHIDWFGATKYGPGRSFFQIQIFVNGKFAGRGVRCGCSLGVGGSDLPAVAPVGRNKAIRVREGEARPRKVLHRNSCSLYLQDDATTQSPVVELWEM